MAPDAGRAWRAHRPPDHPWRPSWALHRQWWCCCRRQVMPNALPILPRMRASCPMTLRLTVSVSLQLNSLTPAVFCAAGSGAPLPALPVWEKILALPLRLLDLATSKFPPGLE